jgi:hypothetical protein
MKSSEEWQAYTFTVHRSNSIAQSVVFHRKSTEEQIFSVQKQQ